MLDFLFRRLTANPPGGAALFDAATRTARQPHWYQAGEVPDTIDGRFALLATVVALILVRLERDGPAGDAVSVALTERFIEVLESEHRELGLGDPALGRTVRKLVGSLANRTALWRQAIADGADWDDATRDSLYKDEPSTDGLAHGSARLKGLRSVLDCTDLDSLASGRLE